MTDRLPFDASNIPKPEPPKPAHREAARYGQFTPDRPLTVSAACELIRRVLADRTPSPLKVVGEVSNFASRGHWYFSLKDEQSILPAVMWSSASKRVPFEPRNGQEVVATGRLDFYGPQGRLQMYVDRLDPVGEGALEIAFRRLCEELRGLGYFEDSTKKPIPPFVSHLAVVTSRDGAALADVIRTARQRWPGIRISVVNVKVQGREAAGEVAAAIDSLSTHHRTLGIDAILVTRGGGSLEDLWAFNEKVVADAIHRCAAPVIAAIGHETDTTIAELTADLRCSTPSQAAARITIDAAAEHHRLAQWTARLTRALRRRSEVARAALAAVVRHEVFRRPIDRLRLLRAELQRRAAELNRVMTRAVDAESRRLAELNRRLTRLEPRTHWAVSRRRLEDAARRLHTAVHHSLASQRSALDASHRQLTAIGPYQVLGRGYSYTADANGTLIRSVAQVAPGSPIRTHLLDGVIRSITEGGEPRAPAAASPPARPSRRRGKRSSPDPSSPGLFEGV